MTMDLQIAPFGGGRYDLVLTETEQGLDAVMIGATEATHPQAVLQRITYALGVWLGESRFDRSFGFPWEQAVFGRQPIDGVPLYLAEHIAGVEGVVDLIGTPVLLYDNEARRLLITDLRVQGASWTLTYTAEITS